MKKIIIWLFIALPVVANAQYRKDQLSSKNNRDIKAYGNVSPKRLGDMFDSLILSLESQRRAAGYLPVGNASGIAVDVPLSGDATLSSAGALTLGANVVKKDANSNISINNSLQGYNEITTSAGTTALFVSSPPEEHLIGSATHTVTLPVVSTLVQKGVKFYFTNLSSGAVTIQSSGGNTIQVMVANSYLVVTNILITGTGTASWSANYQSSISGGGGGGTVTSVSGTTNRITSTGGATPVIDISTTFEALLGKVANPLSQFASTTSSQLAGVISDETGTGSLVYSASPALTGSPTVPTQSASDNSTKAASTAYADNAVLNRVITPTTVKTSNYTAVVGDLVKCDITSGFTVTLPTAPADKSEIIVKIVAPASPSNTLTIAAGGSDVFNVSGGSTSLSLTRKFHSVWLQYQSSGALWIVKSTDDALGSYIAPIANGGTGTTTPAIVAGTNVTVSGSWPNQTINANILGGSNTQTVDYTTVLGDASKIIYMNSSSALNLTIPPNSSVAYPTSPPTVMYVARIGTGTLTFVQGAGVTITSTLGTLTDAGQNVVMTLIKTGTDTWTLQNGTPFTAIDFTGSVSTTGWSSFSVLYYKYWLQGKLCYFDILLAGTSNLTTTTFTLPFTVGSSGTQRVLSIITNNGVDAVGRANFTNGSSTVNVYSTVTLGTWTASAGKVVALTGLYEIQ